MCQWTQLRGELDILNDVAARVVRVRASKGTVRPLPGDRRAKHLYTLSCDEPDTAWRTEKFKFSTDPDLEAKVVDVIGLYLAPPENAIVLCADEKSQIQALTEPNKFYRCSPDITSNAPTTTSDTAPRRCWQPWSDREGDRRMQEPAPPPEFLAFLRHVARCYPDAQLHLVMDNYAAHKHPAVKSWLAANPRIHVHFTSTSGSWLNLVEVWFSMIERQAIRRGAFTPVQPPADRGVYAAAGIELLPVTPFASRVPLLRRLTVAASGKL